MRRFRTTLGLLAVLLLLAPVPAQAWWGWLDDLSGPGKFRGPQFEFRIVCFGPESESKRLVEELRHARELTRKLIDDAAAQLARPGDNTTKRLRFSVAAVDAASDAWRRVTADLQTLPLTFPVLDQDSVKTASESVAKTLRELSDVMSFSVSPYFEIEATKVETFTTPLNALVNTSNSDLQPLVAQVDRGIASIASTGVALSGCSTEVKRRSSIEIGANFWYADGVPGFANGEQIRLTTLMPMFSFRLFTDPRFDFVDAGVGAGVYWFSSKGFDSFSGVVLQPARFDFHAPTLWATLPLKGQKNVWRRVAAAPTFRFSFLEFPAGFSEDAFKGTGVHHAPIPSELNKSWTIFINLDPFVRRPPFATKTSAGAGGGASDPRK